VLIESPSAIIAEQNGLSGTCGQIAIGAFSPFLFTGLCRENAPMRIAILQTAGGPGVVEANLGLLAGKAAEAAKSGVNLLACPELYLTGYNVETARMHQMAEPSDGPAAQRVSDIARKNRLAVLYGYAERDGASVYNAAQFISSEGRALADYRKSHLYGDLEQRSFSPGNSLVCAELYGIPVGILICYDIEFPEPARSLALAGAPCCWCRQPSPSPTTLSLTRWCRHGHGKISCSSSTPIDADPRAISIIWV
jgi:predicted amidohydrolase